MNELKTVSKLVKVILEEDKRTRNSDSFLYLKVIEHIADQKDVDLYGISIPVFLCTMRSYGFPPFESVRRARQKVQAEFPELAASERVSGLRMINETEYRQFARGDIS